MEFLIAFILVFWSAVACTAVVYHMMSRQPQPREGDQLMLTVQVYERPGAEPKVYCNITGPDGGYILQYAVYAAGALTADVIQNSKCGIEGGLEVVERAAMELLEQGKRHD